MFKEKVLSSVVMLLMWICTTNGKAAGMMLGPSQIGIQYGLQACLHPFLTGQSELTFSNNLSSPTLKANNGKLQHSNYLTILNNWNHIFNM